MADEYVITSVEYVPGREPMPPNTAFTDPDEVAGLLDLTRVTIERGIPDDR